MRTVEQMRYLIHHLPQFQNAQDRAYLALHALHPMRLEEVLGLKEKDIDRTNCLIHIERAVTHHARNQPLVKDTKTEASRRAIDLVEQIVSYLAKCSRRVSFLGARNH